MPFKLIVLSVTLAVGCSSATDESPAPLTPEEETAARSVPSSATAEFTTSEGHSFLGAFVGSVGPRDVARFEFGGNESAGGSLSGQYRLDVGALTRTQTGAWVRYSADSEWDWIYDNRGSFLIIDASGERRFLVRSFEYRADESDLFVVRLGGVELTRLDSESQTVSPGPDLEMTVAGRLTVSCWVAGPDGEVLADPTRTANPLCAEMFPRD